MVSVWSVVSMRPLRVVGFLHFSSEWFYFLLEQLRERERERERERDREGLMVIGRVRGTS